MKVAAIICGLGRTHERGIYVAIEKNGQLEIITDQRATTRKKQPKPAMQKKPRSHNKEE